MKNENLKSTLKNGSVVQTRDGDVGFVMDNTIWFVTGLAAGCKSSLDNYDDDLTHLDDSGFEGQWDIVKIWHNCNGFSPDAINNIRRNRKPAWERKEENENCDTTEPFISKTTFVDFIHTLRTFENKLTDLTNTFRSGNDDRWSIPTFADELESKYVALLSKLLNIPYGKDDDLFNWCFADEFGEDSTPLSFGGEQLTAEQVYEKLISKQVFFIDKQALLWYNRCIVRRETKC